MANGGVLPTGLLRDRYGQHDKFVPLNNAITIALNGSLSIPLVEPLFCNCWVSGEDPLPNL